MDIFTIDHDEFLQIGELLRSVGSCSFPLHPPGNFSQFGLLSVYAHRMPERFVEFLTNFKYDESNEGVCLIKGFKIDDNKIARTPDNWRNDDADIRTKEESLFLLLCSAILGDAISWSTQQDGKIVHNIVPIKGDEYKQIGSSTLTKLWWHTEEAFHPCRCDYLGLLCLRNNERVATNFASVNALNITEEDRRILFIPHYSIYPDQAHLAEMNANRSTGVDTPLVPPPEKIPVLFGDYEHPYLCIDPYYMDRAMDDVEADRALKSIISEIDRNLKMIVLEPGDLLILDNYRVVHGREGFKANFDGYGRWLKRVNIVRDLRKSRALRKNFYSRTIETIKP